MQAPEVSSGETFREGGLDLRNLGDPLLKNFSDL